MSCYTKVARVHRKSQLSFEPKFHGRLLLLTKKSWRYFIPILLSWACILYATLTEKADIFLVDSFLGDNLLQTQNFAHFAHKKQDVLQLHFCRINKDKLPIGVLEKWGKRQRKYTNRKTDRKRKKESLKYDIKMIKI